MRVLRSARPGMLCLMGAAFVFFCAALHAQTPPASSPTWQELLAKADSLQKVAQYDSALVLAKQALLITEREYGKEDTSVARVLHMTGVLDWDRGQYGEAERLYLRALAIREKVLGGEHPDVARTLNNLAKVYNAQGRLAEAEPLFKQALEIMQTALGPDHPIVAAILTNLANVYADQGRYADEQPLQERALEIYEKAFGSDHPNVAQNLNNLGNLYRVQGRLDDAELLLKRAVEIDEKALGPEHPDVAELLTNLANIYYDESRYAEAESLERRVLEIRVKLYGPEHWFVGETLNNMANLYVVQGRYAEAEPLFRHAIEIRARALGPDHASIAVILTNLADLYCRQGAFSKACEADLRAWNTCRQNFRNGADVLAERNALEYSQFLSSETSNYLSSLLNSPNGSLANAEEIAHVVFSTKGVVSDGIMARYRSLDTGADSVTAKVSDSLRYARFALSKLYVDGPGEDSTQVYRRKLDAATKNKERLEAELARQSASFQIEQELWDVDAQEIGEALPAGGAHVEFMRYRHRTSLEEGESRYLAVAVKSGGEALVFPLGSAAAIDSAVGEYRDYFQHPAMMDGAGYASVSSAIYQRVWQPLASLLDGATTVFIAPDGDLNLVSFAGLMDETGQYLIEKYPIHYLSSGRDLIRLKESVPSGSGLLAMGDPDFDLSRGMSTASAVGLALLTSLNLRSSCEVLSKLEVPRLPSTRKEVEAVAARWRSEGTPAATYLGAEASEENFKQNAPGKRVIHLATHGFYISEACQKESNTRSALGMQEGGYVGENPLLLSGFLLAGANKHGEGAKEAKREDGIVTAEEVAGLNLSGTDLVILSACETGLGTVKSGEGVYGLRRAFQMAGARTVISALWPIDDKATAEFMGQLFSAQNEDLPHVLQRIALSRISDLRAQGRPDNPFFWAGFVATGDWKTQ